MPEQTGPPPLNPDRAKNPSAPDENAFLWFDGILEGPLGDRDMLRAAATRLDAIGVVAANLEIEGGKFSILLDDSGKRMSQVSDSQRSTLMQTIQEIVDHAADPNKVESTLRCTEVTSSTVHETLFALRDGRVEKVTRGRLVNDDDMRRSPRPISVLGESFEGTKSKRLVYGSLVVLFCLAMSFQLGLVDRFLAPKAEEIKIEHRLFGDYLSSTMESNWGVYTLTIQRGDGFPQTMASFEIKTKAAKRMEDAATLGALARGETVYVQLLGDKGEAIYEKGVSLKPLLLDSDATLKVLIPGLRKAASLRLALTPKSMPR
ncbi:MAG: hypothetical protein ACI97A_001899 [Planctomycetota bacterium]|jgi:hypothetical protein